MNETKLIDFTFCLLCRYFEQPETKDPCNDCLNTPARSDGSRKPIRYWPKTGVESNISNK